MSTTEPLYQLPPVTLRQLNELKVALEAMSIAEADPDAEVFKLLGLVRKTRADAIRLNQLTLERAADSALESPGLAETAAAGRKETGS